MENLELRSSGVRVLVRESWKKDKSLQRKGCYWWNKMASAYYYVRFRWWKAVTIDEIKEKLGPAFVLELIPMPTDDMELSLLKDSREELRIVADSLSVRLSSFRAVLFQKEPAPFTAKDVELRKKILELYPRNRPTPFPWEFMEEPKFHVS